MGRERGEMWSKNEGRCKRCTKACVLFTHSIEFNRDSNLFAVGGVTQKIKIYDYYAVINHSAAFPSPSLVVECPSKLR